MRFAILKPEKVAITVKTILLYMLAEKIVNIGMRKIMTNFVS